MLICPVCVKTVSNWAMATGKAIQINAIMYHIVCVGETKIREIAEGKWQPIKDP